MALNEHTSDTHRVENGWSSASPPAQASRIAGAVLGAAIGDAMGHPAEFLRMEAIRERYGPSGVQGFELFWTREGQTFAPYTDDTQMAEIVLRVLRDSRRDSLDIDTTMTRIAAGFADWSVNPQGGHRAPGNACLRGASQLRQGVPWFEAGGLKDGGCGSVMRAYPFGVVFPDDLDRAERWSVEHSKTTHRAPIALAACGAMAVGTALLISGEPPETAWAKMIEAAAREDTQTARMMERALAEATSGVGPDVTLARLEGWAAHEAIAAGLYVAARHPSDPRAAILAAANTPGDSDSIATLAGALTGAASGLERIPAEWIRDVERAAELLSLAREVAAIVA